MSDDIRDGRLAGALDRAVRGIEPPPEIMLPQVRRGGSRRRALRGTAIGVALVTFVAGLGFVAAGRIDREPKPAVLGGWARFGSAEAGWTIRYPPSWHLQVIDDRKCAAYSVRLGGFISNVPFALHHPGGGTEGACNTKPWSFEQFPRHGAALEIEPATGYFGVAMRLIDRFPLRLRDFLDRYEIPGGPRAMVVGVGPEGQWLMSVRLYFGHRATHRDREIAARMLTSLRLTVPSHSVPRLGTCPTARGVAANFSPSGQAVVRGDIDGDGQVDQTWVVDVPGFPDRCSRFVVVQTAAGRLAARLPEWWAPQMPKVAALARIDTGARIRRGGHLRRGRILTPGRHLLPPRR